MPPFGKEGHERAAKRLAFLSFGDVAKKKPRPKTSQSSPPSAQQPHSRPSTIFGAEREEHDELDAGSLEGRRQSQSGPFGSESEEPMFPRAPQRPGRPSVFGREAEEDNSSECDCACSSSDEEGSDGDFVGNSDSVFALGWNSLLAFSKASGYQKVQDNGPSRKKRAYDNSNRKAAAAYVRSTSGVYKKNGTDEKRLEKLFGAAACNCAQDLTKTTFHYYHVWYKTRFTKGTLKQIIRFYVDFFTEVPTRTASRTSAARKISWPFWQSSGRCQSGTKIL